MSPVIPLLLLSTEVSVIVVDDDPSRSSDTIAHRSAAEHDGRVETIHRGVELGLGTAYVIDLFRGYRAWSETEPAARSDPGVESNYDHWRTDHWVAPDVVPGVVFSSYGLGPYSQLSYRDVPPLVLGKELEQSGSARPPRLGDEDQEMGEEKVRSLGYV